MPTTFNFNNVIANFQTRSKVEVWERKGELVNSEWEWGQEENLRTIAAIVHDKRQTKQKLEFAGLYEEGDINVITLSKLYFTDKGNGDVRATQSWVKYLDRVYRVNGEANMSDSTLSGKGAYHSYNCIREVY